VVGTLDACFLPHRRRRRRHGKHDPADVAHPPHRNLIPRTTGMSGLFRIPRGLDLDTNQLSCIRLYVLAKSAGVTYDLAVLNPRAIVAVVTDMGSKAEETRELAARTPRWRGRDARNHFLWALLFVIPFSTLLYDHPSLRHIFADYTARPGYPDITQGPVESWPKCSRRSLSQPSCCSSIRRRL
jgi:hypothetical protein